MVAIWGGVLVGLVILLLAGDALVKGAVNLSLRIGIPALIVSLTVVAFGTSAPELLISIKAAMENVPGIALGNVVGSNTANILLVLGVPALLAVMHTSECNTRKSYVIMLAASVLFIGLAFRGVFDWIAGIVLLVVLAAILGDSMREALAHRRAGQEVEDEEEPEGADPNMPWWKILLYLALGLVGLPIGADLLVDSSVEIATLFGVSDTVIGLTLVALGTSLPELATTVMAALRRQADVALGNVIGSNMFNLLAIIGVASLIAPIPVDPEFLRFDLWVMLGASLLIFPLVFLAKDLTRIWGVVLSALYLGYIALVIM
ncbi:calcium/sodium antiporter [Marivita sp. XM-24bin2]|jgi:cation:H+ antiporter|uniref:calcium/sodium antiporter n=1 Tax=unclassified Marivita TaxID=2632480 RepID=UPI000D79B56E|nr:calcium/sodium antiporter [Marivita sp. XM-24bin2]MCR9109977.1 calcium/sodium antiporter [Paracoccaceae bacterium]PWL35619.1 MAG: sodium:proton exchanger [Marivita sp. XM-24bin2]